MLTEPFAEWYAHSLGGTPVPEVVDALAAEWAEGTLPETWFSVSPARVRFQRELISDWISDDPVTAGVITLLPEWVRWLGERGGLAADRMQPLLVAAQETPEPLGRGIGALSAR